MKYSIKSFILGVQEAHWILCTTVYGRPARIAYVMGRKLSNGFTDLFEGGWNGVKATKWKSAAADKCRLVEGFTARYKFISRNSGYRHIPRRAEKHGIAVLPGWLSWSRSQIPWIPRN